MINLTKTAEKHPIITMLLVGVVMDAVVEIAKDINETIRYAKETDRKIHEAEGYVK